MKISFAYAIFGLFHLLELSRCGDITSAAFGHIEGSLPAAFGDFNSDELTDLFVINNGNRVEILLGSTVEPYFRKAENLSCTFPSRHVINSVVPGDFDGDALMDVLVTILDREKKDDNEKDLLDVHILWGGINNLTCSNTALFKIKDQPLAIDFKCNMTVDLFGVDRNGTRGFWFFDKNRSYRFHEMVNSTRLPLRVPHSHAFLDLNDDNSPDLYLTGEDKFEIHLWNKGTDNFVYRGEIDSINFPPSTTADNLGQTLFMDVEIADKIDHIVPVCYEMQSNKCCLNSTLFIYSKGQWKHIQVNFQDPQRADILWGWSRTMIFYTEAITLRGGDYNMDGYPDMLATLCQVKGSEKEITDQSFLLINSECKNCIDGFNRTFEIQWGALTPTNTHTMMGVFYDFLQDGILDVIFAHYDSHNSSNHNMTAYKNSLDYDANFIKVMVITGLTNNDLELERTLWGNKRQTFGTNLPGPKVSYVTTTQEGEPRAGVSYQLPQSAHFAMYLPYTIFGLGRTPNFVEDLTVGFSNESRTWTQIIPNSQLVVIPYPPNSPYKWRAQLFVTPSKIILQSVIALLGTCFVILVIIGVLQWKEKREDRIERLQESHRFHFDAM